MALRVTIDIFSGRPNPVITLDAAQARKLLAAAKPQARLARGDMPEPTGILGYRGLIVEQTTAARGLPKRFRIAAGAVYYDGVGHAIADENIEEQILTTRAKSARVKVKGDFRRLLAGELQRLNRLKAKWIWPHPIWPIRPVCPCAPLYEPQWWNDGGQRQFNNNCYNYACNYRTDTFAQPGRANGAMYTALTCASVRPAAVADALIDSPAPGNTCPRKGHVVALVIWPGVDFHWYRRGQNGRWSHKPGGTPVTNLDNSGAIITNPQTADRGGYTDFCSFLLVMHGHIKIN